MVSETAQAGPSGAAEATGWQVSPLGLTGAPSDKPTGGPADRPAGEPPDEPRAGHRLRRLERWLDYAADLGCSGLLLGPIFASLTHGYDTTDYFRIDPRLRGDAHFQPLPPPPRPRGGPVRV